MGVHFSSDEKIDGGRFIHLAAFAWAAYESWSKKWKIGNCELLGIANQNDILSIFGMRYSTRLNPCRISRMTKMQTRDYCSGISPPPLRGV